MRVTFALAALSAASIVPALAQPAPVLHIFREGIKQGRSSAHEKVEMDYVRAYRKAKHPSHYVALSSMSGSDEVLFIMPSPSFARAQEFHDEEVKEPLKSDLEMVEARDGELRASSRGLWAVLRPEMSYHADKLNVGKTRYVSIATYRARLGKEMDMQAGAKAIIDAYNKANVEAVLLCYQVIAGAPAGTYMFFSPMESLKTMDEMPARQRAMAEAMGPGRMQELMKSAGDVFQGIEVNLYSVNPRMSYAPKEFEDVDPDFWRPKAAKPAMAPKPKEKAGM